MAFENLTLFEIRLEDAQFGPRSLGRDDPDDAIEAEEAGSRGRLAAVAAVALVTAGLVVLWRRVRSDADEELAGAYEAGEADLATAE